MVAEKCILLALIVFLCGPLDCCNLLAHSVFLANVDYALKSSIGDVLNRSDEVAFSFLMDLVLIYQK